ncbi:hypothetical protein [Methylobacterium sp. 77]|uniref:hypothetical protein n=1 Tax=Methylobacterium sp. 77 TaxID=1101192 RepID=UPI00036F3A81|nr:hypothetical protein [Methylobacterium sp. 77]
MAELGWYDDVDAPRERSASRVLASIRSAFRPSSLLPGILILVGWLAFIGWTGAGSDGWQARICADPFMQARSCGTIQLEGRIPVSGERSAS